MRLKFLSLLAALALLGGFAPSAASAQCYSPGYGRSHYYPSYQGHYYRSYPSFNHNYYYPRSHGHSYYRRRFWH